MVTINQSQSGHVRNSTVYCAWTQMSEVESSKRGSQKGTLPAQRLHLVVVSNTTEVFKMRGFYGNPRSKPRPPGW